MSNLKKISNDKYEKTVYFSSIKNYTAALLKSFSETPYFVNDEQNNQKQDKYYVPISFNNYEKAVAIEDIDDKMILQKNYNFLPRLVLSFEGLSKNSNRQTQKYQKFTRAVIPIEACEDDEIEFAYNSLSYDFNFKLLLQTRGLTAAAQITETILSRFNPTLALFIEEMRLFDGTTDTRIHIEDPEFDILEEQDKENVNIVNVSFNLKIPGNIYSPIKAAGPLKVMKMFMNTWGGSLKTSNISSYIRYDKNNCGDNTETSRWFDGTGPASIPDGHIENTIESINEVQIIERRIDYVKYEISLTYKLKNEIIEDSWIWRI